MSNSHYDKIGIGYSQHRQADARIVAVLYDLLNLPAGSVVADIGAGTGNYSRALAQKGFRIKAVEPSDTMRKQLSESSRVEVIAGSAENIPLPNNSVDGVIVVLALHHFASLDKAANEIYRICSGGTVVVFTHDPRESADFWFADYFPEVVKKMHEQYAPVDQVAQDIVQGKDWSIEKVIFPLPPDLSDKFTASGWRTPAVYLDPSMRNSMSPFALTDAKVVERGVKRLQNDLQSGDWNKKYGKVRDQGYFDAGYRFLRFKSKAIANKEK